MEGAHFLNRVDNDRRLQLGVRDLGKKGLPRTTASLLKLKRVRVRVRVLAVAHRSGGK